MAVELSTSVMDSLLEKLRLDDPWIPPRSWDSLPAQAGVSSQPSAHSSPVLYSTSTVSEPSLVRLAMNALQGVESALISIEKLSGLLTYSSADRTTHRIPSLWTRCSSTAALGNLLTSIGQFGCLIFVLRRFVNYFTTPDLVGARELEENPESDSCEEGKCSKHNFTLVNQAFAISVGKVIDGYISALNTLSASISLRRSSKSNDGGCLASIGHSEITILEVYLHTMGLRTQIEALGNICSVNHLIIGFPGMPLGDLRTKADSEFSAFPRSGALLSFLYAQLKVVDPDHCALLKFLFLQSYEPYSEFIRAWIYDGSVSDPYHEFIVDCDNMFSIDAPSDSGIGLGLPLPTIRVRDGAALPCFLEDCVVPLCRTGQQLQVIIKLLELSTNVSNCDTYEEIVPSLSGLSSEYPWFEFPLTFNKGTIETMVLVRANYYQQMLEKVESILTKFDFSYRQAASQMRIAQNLKKNLNHQASSVIDESSISSLADGRSQNTTDIMVDAEVPGIINECSYAEDHSESSECTSSEGLDEQNESEKTILASCNMEPSYLSALDLSLILSTENTMQNQYQCEVSYFDVPFKINWKSGYSAYPSYKERCLLRSEQKLSKTPEIHVTSKEHDLCLSDGYDIGWDKHDALLHSPDQGLKHSMGDCELLNTELGVSENVLKVKASNTEQNRLGCASSKTFNLHFAKLRYDSTFFSMNPTLNRGFLFNLRPMPGERGHANYVNSYFDFTSVKDPLEACQLNLVGDHGPEFGAELQVINESPIAGIDASKQSDIKECNNVNMENNAKLCNVSSPRHNKGINEEHLLLPNVSGGSPWESLLGRSGNNVNRSLRDYGTKLVAGADLPPDFVIKNCVLDEILLQYKYVSKLTIKLLIEGFKLQEHLLALRRYHFMELADWADLFIMSLWHHKWNVNEVDKRIPEIQGVLELAVQRSSCEGDPNKERLCVYLKEDGIRHPSISMGIHSFDFLGLGYRIDWPVNIILTPAALDIYSDIFNFLLRVKLAVFSLSDAWCSLKGYHLEQHKGEVGQISVLTETRHQLNHFLSTFQQYVQSQLSQVSWYRFLHTLKHKVKDMLDLELVHMAYLTESLHICFLSNETRSVAGIIQNILQCAIDFRSCLTGSIMAAGSDDEIRTNIFSQNDFSQVNSIRRVFAKNLEELYLIYLQSPKHGEFGLSRFWDYLNYNEYYAGVMSKNVGHFIFYS